MAHLSKHPTGRWRIRYILIFPDGSKADRSRLFASLKEAKMMLHRAGLMEEAIKFRHYTAEDLAEWRALNLISDRDRRLLAAILTDQIVVTRTLGEAAKDYMDSLCNLSRKEIKVRAARVRRILSILGASTPVAAIKPMDAEFLKKRLLESGLAVSTVNRCLQELKRIVDREVLNGYVPYNSLQSVKNVRSKEKFQPRVFTPEEVERVLKEARKSRLLYGWIYLLLLFAFGCGLRRSEILALRWEWINWERRLLAVKRTKTGRPRIVGLGERLFRELTRLREKFFPDSHPRGPIFPPLNEDHVTKSAKQIFRKCGIPEARLHDARHTYVTMLQEVAGATPVETMARSGHASVEMLLHYSHPANKTIFEDNLPYMT